MNGLGKEFDIKLLKARLEDDEKELNDLHKSIDESFKNSQKQGGRACEMHDSWASGQTEIIIAYVDSIKFLKQQLKNKLK